VAAEGVGTPSTTRRQRGSLALIVVVVFGGLLAATAIAVFLIALVFPAVSAYRAASHKTACASNLQAIALAIQKYEAEHGSLPPAYVADASGKPLHSWRVLILPYLGSGYDHIYRRYDFNQPWDGPNNQQLFGAIPAEYVCPADPDARAKRETNYMVAVGKRTMFPREKSAARTSLRDGVQDTLLLVETPATGVCWLEPRDLDADQMLFKINGKVGVEIGSAHPGGAHVCTVDGQTHFLTDSAPPDALQAMTTIDGGETVPWYLVEE
jgi:type II secretory pathway pseudopilin PulG